MTATTGTKLPQSFYDRPTLEVARQVLGKHLVYHSPLGELSARIVEVEAYIGQNDPACHAARGMTERNRVMFGPPGFCYIYFIYGMYHCLNFVTERSGFPAALLVRGAEPGLGTEIMKRNSPRNGVGSLLNGPGKLCRSFGLTREQNGLDLTGKILYLEDRDEPEVEIVSSPRIGISQGRELLYRFYDTTSECVSR